MGRGKPKSPLISMRIRAGLSRIRDDHAFDSVKTEAGLAQLPADEAARWKELWKRFEALAK